MLRKRERENPCLVCGHFHKYEEGEPCAVCGHRKADPASSSSSHGGENGFLHLSAFPSEILPGFLYLGSYDNASRSELLKAQGIARILNTVPSCPNLYRNSFMYHNVADDVSLPFDDCFHFIEETRAQGDRVLVHCMSGQSRSPAVVVAYLMRHKQVSLAVAVQWVKERHTPTNLSQRYMQQLQEYESRLRTQGPADASQPASAPPTNATPPLLTSGGLGDTSIPSVSSAWQQSLTSAGWQQGGPAHSAASSFGTMLGASPAGPAAPAAAGAAAAAAAAPPPPPGVAFPPTFGFPPVFGMAGGASDLRPSSASAAHGTDNQQPAPTLFQFGAGPGQPPAAPLFGGPVPPGGFIFGAGQGGPAAPTGP